MAEVWAATDQVLDRPVAIKLLHPHLAEDAAFVDRFRREAIAAARLKHPSIVDIYDTYSGVEDGEAGSGRRGDEAIVMELVRGESLRRRLDERGTLPAREAAGIAAKVADALQTAHRAGLVHRDIKPANILLDDERVLVADFGIAKLAEAGDHTQEGTMLGTAKYLAPEQVSGAPVDGRTDVYSLGIVLYEMVCGRVPFAGDNDTATVLARLHNDPTPPREVRPDVPPALEAVILQALQRDPDDRFGSAAEMRSALLSAAGATTGRVAAAPRPPTDATFVESHTPARGTPTTAPPAAPPPRREPDRSGHWVGPAILIGVVIVALAVAGVLLGRALGNGLFGGDDTGTGGGGAQEGPAGTSDTLVATPTAFDPEGDGSEHDEEAALAVDGDTATAWETESYSSPDFGNLKAGVGLVLTLQQAQSLEQLDVVGSSTGWSADVYVASSAAGDLAGWGTPVASQRAIGGPVTFDLGGAEGGAVLLWITDLGSENRVQVAEVALTPA